MSLHLNESESPASKAPVSTGLGIFLGLLLTVALHLLQFLLALMAAATENDKLVLIFFFFGFTQLLYMIPAILYFRRRNERGLMIGLIIGASLTFVLGLPVAGLGYICATQPMTGFH